MKWFKQWRWKRKRIKKAKALERSLQLAKEGVPQVNVIQGQATSGKSARNLARIKTCEEVMADMRARGWDRIKPERYRPWAEEYKRRIGSYPSNIDRRLIHFSITFGNNITSKEFVVNKIR